MAEHAHSTAAPAATLRSRIERAVELLIDYLDRGDGDPDLEASDEREPENEDGAAWAEVADQRLIFPVEPAGLTARSIARQLAAKAEARS